MQNFTELARRRRSIRKFTPEKLTEDQVVELMKAALFAPSSKGSRPWEFVLVDDPVLLHELSECKPAGAELVAGAPLAVVVAADTTRTEAWVEDASVAATMLLLQAEDMGLGACWVQVNGRTQDDGTPSADIVRDILNLPAECAPLAIVAVGHKAAERKPQNDEKLLWEKIHLNGYRHEDKGVRCVPSPCSERATWRLIWALLSSRTDTG